jgi:hypothetical protein
MSEVTLDLASRGFYMDEKLGDTTWRLEAMDPFLRQILLDVTNIVRLFNMNHNGLRVSPNVLQEIIISVGYRLVRFSTLSGPQPRGELDSACHIGLTSFLTTLFIQAGRKFMKYSLVARRLVEVIDKGSYGGDNDLALWLLFIGGISVLRGMDQMWLLSKIRQSSNALKIKDWDGLHQYLVLFPWICCVHDEPAKALWYSASIDLDRVGKKSKPRSFLTS